MEPRLAWHPAQRKKRGTYIDLGGLLHPCLHLLSQGLPKIRAGFVLKHQRVNERVHWSALPSSAPLLSRAQGPRTDQSSVVATAFPRILLNSPRHRGSAPRGGVLSRTEYFPIKPVHQL